MRNIALSWIGSCRHNNLNHLHKLHHHYYHKIIFINSIIRLFVDAKHRSVLDRHNSLCNGALCSCLCCRQRHPHRIVQICSNIFFKRKNAFSSMQTCRRQIVKVCDWSQTKRQRFKSSVCLHTSYELRRNWFCKCTFSSCLTSACRIVSVLHQNTALGKSITEACWDFLRPEILRVEGNLEGGGDGFPNTSWVLVEYGQSLITNPCIIINSRASSRKLNFMSGCVAAYLVKPERRHCFAWLCQSFRVCDAILTIFGWWWW